MGGIFNSLRKSAKAAGSRPVVTCFGPEGQRSELSRATLLNSAVKTANFMDDVLGLGPGDTIALRLPAHWQVPAWLSAADAIGIGVILLPPGSPAPNCEATVDADPQDATSSTAPLAVLVSTHPLGLPAAVPEGVVDHARETLGQPDEIVVPESARLAVTPTDHEKLEGAEITRLASVLATGLDPAARLLSHIDPWTTAGALACWAVPILTGSAVVLADSATQPDGSRPSAVTESERITHIASSVHGVLNLKPLPNR